MSNSYSMMAGALVTVARLGSSFAGSFASSQANRMTGRPGRFPAPTSLALDHKVAAWSLFAPVSFLAAASF